MVNKQSNCDQELFALHVWVSQYTTGVGEHETGRQLVRVSIDTPQTSFFLSRKLYTRIGLLKKEYGLGGIRKKRDREAENKGTERHRDSQKKGYPAVLTETVYSSL